MKRRKIKWLNVIKALGFVGCIGVILHDMYMITIHGWVTGYMASWTWLGFITFIMAFVIAGTIYEDFEEQIKSMPNTGTVKHTTK